MQRTLVSAVLVLLVSLSLALSTSALAQLAVAGKTPSAPAQLAEPGDRGWPRGYSPPSEA